jgi:hypothetical protein
VSRAVRGQSPANQIRKSDGMPMLDYLVIVLAFAIVCGATLLFMKATG